MVHAEVKMICTSNSVIFERTINEFLATIDIRQITKIEY